MSKRTVIDCDRCGALDIAAGGTVYADVGVQIGVEGSEARQDYLELCPTCLCSLLNLALSKRSHEENLALFRNIRNHMRMRRAAIS